MDLIQAVFGTVVKWFGFVGSCAVGPSATCVPFIVFFALAVASGATLWLIARAYARLRGEDEHGEKERREALSKLKMQQSVRRAVVERVASRPVGQRGWRMPA